MSNGKKPEYTSLRFQYLALLKNFKIIFFRPGGELNPAEDEVEGLKRLLTEVTSYFFIIH